jgi:DNA-binding MarR family transcriptional regulator
MSIIEECHRGGTITLESGGVGFLLARAGGRAIRNLNRALEGFDLRSRHYTVLLASVENGGLSQRELGGLLGIDPSAVVALVDDLERADLVRREPHPEDRRTRLVVATRTGRATLKRAHELAERVDDELLDGLTAAQRRTLRDLLSRISVN